MITIVNSAQLGVHLELRQGQITQFAIESVNAFIDVVQSLINQAEGNEGAVHFYDEDSNERSLQKNALLITDPLRLSLNEKAILTPIQSRVTNTILEELTLIWQDLQANMYAVINEAIKKHDDIPLVSDIELDPAFFVKTMGLALDDGHSFFERLITYIDLTARFTKLNLLIFVNLRTYLTDEQWEELKERLSHTTLSLLLIEQVALNTSGEKSRIQQTIVDSDRCIIL